jgi:hypothetical protein
MAAHDWSIDVTGHCFDLSHKLIYLTSINIDYNTQWDQHCRADVTISVFVLVQLMGWFLHSFLYAFKNFSAAQPYLLHQVNNQLSWFPFLSRTLSFLFISKLTDFFVSGQTEPFSKQPGLKVRAPPQHNHLQKTYSFWQWFDLIPVSSRSVKQPGWRSPPIVIIALAVIWPDTSDLIFLKRCCVWPFVMLNQWHGQIVWSSLGIIIINSFTVA